MFEPRPNLVNIRGFIAVVCLSLLAGCAGGNTDTPTAAPPETGAAQQASVPETPKSITANPSDATVTLTWIASTGATSYHVKRSATSGGTYVQIATTPSPSYTDTTVINGTTYYYVVAASNSQGTSSDSEQVTATLIPVISTPSAPTDLAITSGNSQISLTWSASNSATSYIVKRSLNSGGPYSQVSTPTTTSYADFSVTNGTAYYYVVSAINSSGESANSVQVSGLPSTPPPPPTTFGTWINVTPPSVNLTSNLSCGNYGTETVQADPAHPSNIYTQFFCQGIWKSTDYGATWTGPINIGTNGAAVSDCAGGITISSSNKANVPTIYAACTRGVGTGFWKSVDGGVNWTRYFVAPSGAGRQDYYPPVVDPYDQNHLLMVGHEMDFLVESIDGGQNWTNVSIDNGMLETGGTGAIFFINTGDASSTRGTWLWMGQQSGGVYGTWRTSSSGANWIKVDKNEHPHGASQIYQPDNNGVVYMAGAYSSLGWGVLRSGDYGQTWTHIGMSSNETVVVGTSKNVYSMFGYPIGPGGSTNPAFEISAQPGTGSWVTPNTPDSLTQGSAQIAVLNDGSHNILVSAMWNSGVWRYIEP